MDFTRLGSVTTNRKNGLAGQQLAVGTDSRSVSTGPSRMLSVLTEGCHVGYSREFVGTVYCTDGQSNTTNDVLLSTEPFGSNFNEICIKIQQLPHKKIDLNMPFAKWLASCLNLNVLTHRGRVTHICVSKLTTIGSDNGLLPGRRQAIIWTNVGILLIGPLGTNFSENLIEIYTFSFRKMHLKIQMYCLGNGGHFVSASMWVSEWVIKFNGLSRTADSEVHIVHISRVIIACTLNSLSPPT